MTINGNNKRMAQKRNYEKIAKELEMAVYLQNIVIKETIKNTGITRQDFKYLVIANILTKKNGLFETREIAKALRAECYPVITVSIVRLMALGYIELIKGRKYGSSIGRKYATTGTAIYLVRKYTDIMRRYLKDDET